MKKLILLLLLIAIPVHADIFFYEALKPGEDTLTFDDRTVKPDCIFQYSVSAVLFHNQKNFKDQIFYSNGETCTYKIVE
jgi:hypothetical protein